MTKAEFTKAYDLALSGEDLNGEDLEQFDGFGLNDFKQVVTTVKAVARLIRWQTFFLNGEIDYIELNEIYRHGKRKFLVIG